jgi:trigger factor
VTDADVDQAVTDALENTQVVDEGARKGDQVFVGVTGIIDNSKVSEESNDGVQLEIGKSDMPSGFDEGIVGMKPGDTKDIQLTLPKEYEKNTKLSGKNIIYRVVMNSITRSYSELTEDWLHKYTEYKTIDDYKNAVKKNLEQEKVIKKGIGNEDEIWNRLEKICTVNKYLKSEVDLAKKQYELNMDNNLNLSEIDLDTYKKQMNLSDKDYEKQKGKDIKKSVERNMIVSAIAKKEGYSIDDEESGTVISDMAEDYQMSEESFRALFEKKDLEKQVMSRRVINLITENQSNLH